MKRLLILTMFACPALFAAVHPTKAQTAYFDEHEKCSAALKAAKKNAKAAAPEARRKALEEARAAYRKCEAHAQLVWKFYPAPPPVSETAAIKP